MTFPGFNLPRWAAVLQNRIATDGEGEDSAVEGAEALAEVLEPEYLDRLTERLITIRKERRKRR